MAIAVDLYQSQTIQLEFLVWLLGHFMELEVFPSRLLYPINWFPNTTIRHSMPSHQNPQIEYQHPRNPNHQFTDSHYL